MHSVPMDGRTLQSATPSPPIVSHKFGRRRFLRILLGVGILSALGKGADSLLARTLCRPGSWNGPLSDHFDGKTFHNVPETSLPASSYGTAPIIRWLKDRLRRGSYPIVERNNCTPQLARKVDGRDWEITMVNHSTLFLRLANYNILTDPVWSDYTSPIQGIGPCRTRPPGIAWDALPKIDVCLLSHDHYDHFDVPTLCRLEERDHPLFILPLGLRSLLEYHVEHSVHAEEKDWWECVKLPRLTITLTPARHWSKRYRTVDSTNRSLWCGFFLRGTEKGSPAIYFAGDSARTQWSSRIRERLGAPDVALLPIGAYKPDWIRAHHTSPADAVQALHTLDARLGIACHFGTWQLANEGYAETLSDLTVALQKNGIPASRSIAPENGQTLRGSAN